MLYFLVIRENDIFVAYVLSVTQYLYGSFNDRYCFVVA